jgi:hypothetical protein
VARRNPRAAAAARGGGYGNRKQQGSEEVEGVLGLKLDEKEAGLGVQI